MVDIRSFDNMMRLTKKGVGVGLIAALLVVSGCATGREKSDVKRGDTPEPNPSYIMYEGPIESRSRGPVAGAREQKGPVAALEEPERKTVDRSGEGGRPGQPSPPVPVGPRKDRPPPSGGGNAEVRKPVKLAFDNADLHEVLDATLYSLFEVNYMVDPSIKANVTFHLAGDFTVGQFINVLNNILQLNNLAITRGPGNIYKVVRRTSSAAVGNTLLQTKEDEGEAGDVTRLIRLRYVSAAIAGTNLRPFLSTGAVVVADSVNNSIIITDTVENIAKAVTIIGIMDVPYFDDILWRLFQLKEVEAENMAKDLNTVLKTGGLYSRPGMDVGSVQVIPIKTMNAILVMTRWPSMMDLVENWIAAMDHSDKSGMDVFVYFVENGTAMELANILKQLYGGTATGSSSSKKKIAIVKPDPNQKTQGPATVSSGELAGDVEIIADEVNNAIVFKATRRDYKIIKGVLEKLDVMPRQVLINVVIAEITLNGSLKYGVEWFLQGHAGQYSAAGALSDKVWPDDPVSYLKQASGFTGAILDGAGALRGLVSLLETEGEVDVLSSPNILAVDNKESYIEVGEEVPLLTSSVTNVAGENVTNTIQYRPTGIILKVTPRINSSGLVKLEISQEVSDVGPEYTELKTNSITNRKAITSMVVEDGQTIVIGGLMKTKRDTSDNGIPYLKDIPVLGFLFGSTGKTVSKTELIFLITPNVIESRQEADAITREFTRRVDQMKEIIENRKY